MDPAEIEFIAEQEKVSIIPKFTDQRIIHLISGDIGPFRAGIPVVVPLWVAIHLRQRKKCTIVAPDWMDLELLEEKLEEEKNSRFFTKMPNDHYMGITHLIFEVAAQDIDHSERIRTAIKDLWDLRVSKARSSADTFLKGGGRHAGIDYLTQMEICTLRPLLLDALDTTYRLNAPLEDASFLNTSSFVSQSQQPGSSSSR